MNKTVVIHQPDFLPYIGFFHKFLYADLWVVLDDVQFLSGSKSWHNRDKIRTSKGSKWLTASVKKCSRNTLINEVYLADDSGWKENNLNLLKANYGKAKYFDEIWLHIESLYSFRTSKLLDFNMKSIELLMELLNAKIDYTFSSKLDVCGKSNELLANIVKKVNGTVYFSGKGALSYFSPVPFDKANIKVKFHEFEHPEYRQVFNGFVPYLSAIDMLFNCGVSRSREIICEI